VKTASTAAFRQDAAPHPLVTQQAGVDFTTGKMALVRHVNRYFIVVRPVSNVGTGILVQ
jgi:hypothetical protein